jgi:hypothetical protein
MKGVVKENCVSGEESGDHVWKLVWKVFLGVWKLRRVSHLFKVFTTINFFFLLFFPILVEIPTLVQQIEFAEFRGEFMAHRPSSLGS